MNQAVTVRYFDGQISKAHNAQIHPVFYQGQADGLVVVWRNTDNTHQQKRYFAKNCEYLPSVDNSPHAIMLSDGARIEFLGSPPDWIELQHRSLFDNITKMENRWAWIGTGLMILCVFVFGLFRFGIPMASHHITQRLPSDVLMEAGNHAEEYVMKMTGPSALSKARQDEIKALYDKLDGNPKAKIIVRSGGDIGANALAIPNNTIVITDELIELSGDDNEILAVLAHEQGHLVHRHSLEQAISSIGVGVLVIVITGDASDLILALPTMLAATQYSQAAEMEADKFAIDELKRLGISPLHLANFFEKMKKEDGNGQGHWSVLSTHPKTDKRIEQVKKHSE